MNVGDVNRSLRGPYTSRTLLTINQFEQAGGRLDDLAGIVVRTLRYLRGDDNSSKWEGLVGVFLLEIVADDAYLSGTWTHRHHHCYLEIVAALEAEDDSDELEHMDAVVKAHDIHLCRNLRNTTIAGTHHNLDDHPLGAVNDYDSPMAHLIVECDYPAVNATVDELNSLRDHFTNITAPQNIRGGASAADTHSAQLDDIVFAGLCSFGGLSDSEFGGLIRNHPRGVDIITYLLTTAKTAAGGRLDDIYTMLAGSPHRLRTHAKHLHGTDMAGHNTSTLVAADHRAAWERIVDTWHGTLDELAATITQLETAAAVLTP